MTPFGGAQIHKSSFFRDAQHADTQSHDILYRFMIETDISFYIILQLIFSQSTFMDLKSAEECK